MKMEKDTILIADDAEINREVLRFIFEEQYNIIEAADGEQTIPLIEEYGEKLRLIFLDLIMPEKTGLDVLRFMNEKHYIDIIPVILIYSRRMVTAKLIISRKNSSHRF